MFLLKSGRKKKKGKLFGSFRQHLKKFDKKSQNFNNQRKM